MNQEIDWLRESAKAFAKLKNIKYNLLITHAGKLVNLSIGFDNSHYAIYVFLAKDGESCYVTRSLFRDARDYTEGQHRFTILHKEKINIKTGENKVLFSSLENK